MTFSLNKQQSNDDQAAAFAKLDARLESSVDALTNVDTDALTDAANETDAWLTSLGLDETKKLSLYVALLGKLGVKDGKQDAVLSVVTLYTLEALIIAQAERIGRGSRPVVELVRGSAMRIINGALERDVEIFSEAGNSIAAV